jgi:hypothetical protein
VSWTIQGQQRAREIFGFAQGMAVFTHEKVLSLRTILVFMSKSDETVT